MFASQNLAIGNFTIKPSSFTIEPSSFTIEPSSFTIETGNLLVEKNKTDAKPGPIRFANKPVSQHLLRA
jgi:hypothetical protein